MRFLTLTNQNYTMYAMKHYDNPQCGGVEEFTEDLNRTKYLKRLLRKYLVTGELRERLILNHLVIFYNVFGIEAANRLLFFRLEPELHACIKPFLLYLNHITDDMVIEGITMATIPLDHKIVKTLRSLGNW